MILYALHEIEDYLNTFCHEFDDTETEFYLGWAMGVEDACDTLPEGVKETFAIPVEYIPRRILDELTEIPEIKEYIEGYANRLKHLAGIFDDLEGEPLLEEFEGTLDETH